MLRKWSVNMYLKKKIIISIILSSILFGGAWGNEIPFNPLSANRSAEAATAPTDYAVWDRRPSEDRLYDKYIATKEIDLVSKPHGLDVVKTLYPGDTMDGVSCVVYSHPSKHAIEVTRTTRVLKYHGSYKNQQDYITLFPGTYVYLIMYVGEGDYYALYCTQYDTQLISVPSGIENLDDRQNPWARYVGEATDKDLDVDFWMCYRAEDGTVGWVNGMGGAEVEWFYRHARQKSGYDWIGK